MKSWRGSWLLLAGVAFAAVTAIPALGQQEGPESLLPPGFGNSQQLPPPVEQAPTPTPASPPAPGAPPVAGQPAAAPASATPAEAAELAAANPLEGPRPTNYFTVPDDLQRDPRVAGVLGDTNGGLGARAWGDANGGFLARLMQDLDAPLPSRWTSILLRRALLTRTGAPAGVDPVDWVAARVDLLVRMGEADAARMLVESVDPSDYTPRMIAAAARAALASADPSALCPLVGPARSRSRNTVWTLADAICAALEGEPTRASALADEARRRGAGGLDLLLARKVIGAGAQARESVDIEWEGVGALSPWRFGLASATGLAIPAPLIESAGPRYAAWLARAPMVPLDQRLDAAATAAALGVFSSRSLVEIHSLMLDQTDPAEMEGTVAARLRAAWIAPTPARRIAAMRGLWDGQGGAGGRYARLILTAGAAARIEPSADHAAVAGDLVASMLAAGMDGEAARWSAVAGDDRAADSRAWALLAVGTPRPAVELGNGRIRAYIDADTSPNRIRAQMLVAALAGLGRIAADDARELAREAGMVVPLDRWAEAIDRAARARQPATVALLAGVGMQTAGWGGIPPGYLFRIVRDLRAVGLEFEARMIAAEAIARL